MHCIVLQKGFLTKNSWRNLLRFALRRHQWFNPLSPMNFCLLLGHALSLSPALRLKKAEWMHHWLHLVNLKFCLSYLCAYHSATTSATFSGNKCCRRSFSIYSRQSLGISSREIADASRNGCPFLSHKRWHKRCFYSSYATSSDESSWTCFLAKRSCDALFLLQDVVGRCSLAVLDFFIEIATEMHQHRATKPFDLHCLSTMSFEQRVHKHRPTKPKVLV